MIENNLINARRESLGIGTQGECIKFCDLVLAEDASNEEALSLKYAAKLNTAGPGGFGIDDFFDAISIIKNQYFKRNAFENALCIMCKRSTALENHHLRLMKYIASHETELGYDDDKRYELRQRLTDIVKYKSEKRTEEILRNKRQGDESDYFRFLGALGEARVLAQFPLTVVGYEVILNDVYPVMDRCAKKEDAKKISDYKSSLKVDDEKTIFSLIRRQIEKTISFMKNGDFKKKYDFDEIIKREKRIESIERNLLILYSRNLDRFDFKKYPFEKGERLVALRSKVKEVENQLVNASFFKRGKLKKEIKLATREIEKIENSSEYRNTAITMEGDLMKELIEEREDFFEKCL